MAAPAGAPTSENVSGCAGRSESVALAVNVYGASSGSVALAGTPESTGATFASVTLSEMGASVLSAPSVTRTANEELPGPSASVGVQKKTPVVGWMDAPGGAPTSENVSAWAGRSESVAAAVNV